MVVQILEMLGTALALTIAIELAVAFICCGVRNWRALLVVALAQVVTNPSVELLALYVEWSPRMSLMRLPWLVIAGAELAAWAVEALLYRAAGVSDRPWALSAVLNGASFGLGLIFAWTGIL